jgi:hypothetical protein
MPGAAFVGMSISSASMAPLRLIDHVACMRVSGRHVPQHVPVGDEPGRVGEDGLPLRDQGLWLDDVSTARETSATSSAMRCRVDRTLRMMLSHKERSHQCRFERDTIAGERRISRPALKLRR